MAKITYEIILGKRKILLPIVQCLRYLFRYKIIHRQKFKPFQNMCLKIKFYRKFT